MNGDGLISAIKGTADALGHLVSAHGKLIRAELREDAAKLAKYLVGFILAALLAGTGYVLLMLGMAALLATQIGWWASLALVGGVHLVAGGITAWRMIRNFHTLTPLNDSAAVTRNSVAQLTDRPTDGSDGPSRPAFAAGENHG